MAFNLNRVTLAGNLTRDPELKKVGDTSVANTALAINSKFKNKAGESVEEVTFVELTAWGKTAELMAQYLTKGSGVCIEGKLKMDTWEDKTTQAKRSKLSVTVEQVHFVGSKPTESAQSAPVAHAAKASSGRPSPAANNDEEPPF